MVAGYGMAAISRPLLALAGWWPVVLLLRLLDRFGKGLRSAPRDALLARSVPADQRGLAFGLHRAMDNGGAVLGPLLAAWLVAQKVPLPTIFAWAALPGAVVVALSLAVREPAAAPLPKKTAFSWDWRGLPAAFRRYLLVLGLFTLGNSSNMFLLLRAKEAAMPAEQVPLVWAAVSAVAMVLSAPLSALSDRLGRTRLIVSGWILYAAFYLAVGMLHDWRWMWPLFASYGVFLAATEGAEKALVADMVAPELLGTAYGWFNLVCGLTLLPASLLFGWIWHGAGPMAAFAFSATCAAGAAVLLAVWAALRQRHGTVDAAGH